MNDTDPLGTLLDVWAADPAVAALAPAETESGIPVRPLYTPRDWPAERYAQDLGVPGAPPFTRGPYPTMHRGQPWSIRQYAGFATAEESNARYRYLLDQGQTALSVAFDLPTQIGYDSDHPLAYPEVGQVGVAIDHAGDMERLFRWTSSASTSPSTPLLRSSSPTTSSPRSATASPGPT